MKNSQHTVCVERSVMNALRKHVLPSGVNIPLDDASYARFNVDPVEYNDANTFKRVYAVSSFLRKWKGLKAEIDLEATALTSWLEAERQCFRTNKRLETEASTGKYSVAPSTIVAAQRKIAAVLGRFDVKKIDTLCRFGNGATYDLRHGATHAKKTMKPSVTFSALPLVCHVLSGDNYMSELVGGFSDLKIVETNRMVMVPKNCKTHRVIAAEPTLNSFVQQGFGRYIRARLKQFGVDLDDQTINQDLAFRALVDELSTIDLSSASDTLCINLVKLLLPSDWFEALESLRSPKTQYKNQKFVLSKFSSMGNAYTFELESLIFWSLCKAVCDENDVVSVYGDDIVIPNARYRPVVDVLTWAGFSVNGDKSFTEGSRFYESCGVHYFDLEEVTPCFQKDVCTRPVDFIRLHNRLVRAGIRLELRKEFWACARVVRDCFRRSFPKLKVDYGPVVEYDEYFIDPDYRWTSGLVDRVKLGSFVTVTSIRRNIGDLENFAYLGRKLRLPMFLNPCPRGLSSESKGHTHVFRHKWHWRSSSFG